MKKEYIVELREEEADKLMDEHWVGWLVRCKDCKKHGDIDCPLWTDAVEFETKDDWFCADGERR